ncbi:MAG TPA: DUF4926 domain-containing protein [Phototrophicaceae bacterium]|jgi:hypothetical protein|nr:DUF4926 domain-containing protein [Phototrophicaceae bacterium]
MNLYDVVALLEDLPEHGLKRGQVGTLVEEWTPGVYKVEFSDTSGITYAMVALRADQLMTLYWHPTKQNA